MEQALSEVVRVIVRCFTSLPCVTFPVLAAVDPMLTLSSLIYQAEFGYYWGQIDGAHTLGATAVSWAPAEPKGSLLSGKPPGHPVKRFVSGGCDNAVKVRGYLPTCLLRHMRCVTAAAAA